MYIMLHGSKDNDSYLKRFILPEACNILGRYPAREESEEKESEGISASFPLVVSLRLKDTGLLAQIKAQLTRNCPYFEEFKRIGYMNYEVFKTGICSEKDVGFCRSKTFLLGIA